MSGPKPTQESPGKLLNAINGQENFFSTCVHGDTTNLVPREYLVACPAPEEYTRNDPSRQLYFEFASTAKPMSPPKSSALAPKTMTCLIGNPFHGYVLRQLPSVAPDWFTLLQCYTAGSGLAPGSRPWIWDSKLIGTDKS